MQSEVGWASSTKISVLLALAVLAGQARTDDYSAAGRAAAAPPAVAGPPAAAAEQVEITPEIRRVLDQINGLGPYQVPELKLKNEEKYAHIPQNYKPFRHVKPYKEYFLTQMEYTGPGRAIPEPEHVQTVKIGFLGPLYATVSVATGGKSHEEILGTKMRDGARLAVEEANARGGYLKRKIPFQMVEHNDNGLWGSSGNEIVNMAYKDKVWAILGSIDGANSHIAIRVALKAEILVMNSGDTDPTYIETNIPWTCRVIGDDRQMNYMLADYMYQKLGIQRVGIIRASNRYGRFGVRKLFDASRRAQHPVRLEMAYALGTQDFSLHLERLRQAGVDAIIHWGDAADGARILNQMRAQGMQQPYFACDRCLSDEFVTIAGANAEGVVCTFPWDPSRKDPRYLAFCERFRRRFHSEPETYAAHGYDGMNMLLWAIQVAGLNRAKIRDVIAYRTEPWKGVTGDIQLSSVLDDIGEVYLAKRQGGAWKYYSRADLGIARPEAPAKEVTKE
jgi:ABC-type branched-subunit amino acid transport system substrate-binding protein